MAVPYTIVQKKIPSPSTPAISYYPRVTKSGALDLDELSERVSNSCSVTQSDCYAVVIGLVNEIAKGLEQGNIVHLGQLGAFQISVQSHPSATPDEVNPSKIKRSTIVFRPGKKLKKMLAQLTFIPKLKS